MAETQTSSSKSIEAPESGTFENSEKNGSSDVVTTNISGHIQEMDRQFGLWSICATGIVTGNTWTAIGGAIVSIQTNTTRGQLKLLTRENRSLQSTMAGPLVLFMSCKRFVNLVLRE
jgi:ATP-dependent Lon protease